MISWRDGAGALHGGSLFAAFAALARGEAWSFPALRPHQREAWHAFTVQVAAMAMLRAGETEPPGEDAAWRDLLVGLADGSADAWELVVDDWSRPALLQPPLPPDAGKAAYKNRLATPDALDMLVTAKNHDVKQERIGTATEEDWLFALVTLQTSEGYGGKDNHGISRMNGGLSNRMSLSIRPGEGGAAAAFRRDLGRLLDHAGSRADRRGGTGLLWTAPWDGTQSLDYTGLDELYVEVCRRIRLVRTGGGIEGLGATSAVPRVAAKELRGRTGDPWAPLKADGSESVTAAANGFGYRSMARLLKASETKLPLLAESHASDGAEGLSIVAAALVRGQGKTEGLHRRTIRTSRMADIAGRGPRALDRVGEVAFRRAADAREANKRLRTALILLVQGGPEQARLDDDAAGKKVEPWLRRFDAQVDRDFFDADLWAEAAGDPVPHRTRWRARLKELARDVFDGAEDAAPRTAMRRVRAMARARNLLDAQMNRWLKELPDGE